MYYTFKNTTGVEFEDAIIEKIGQVSIRSWGKGAFKTSSMQQDQYEGADCNVVGIPIDVTLNFNGKNRMKRINTVLDVQFGKIYFGIRYGNGRVTFKTPVLVIGFDTVVYKSNVISVVELLSDKVYDILNTGMDLYLENVEAI